MMNRRQNPTRVVVINDRSIAHGGATAVALLSARLLRQRGIPVTFLSGDIGNNAELTKFDVAVHALGDAALLEASTITSFRRGLFNKRAKALVESVIRQYDSPTTIYHVHTWNQILSPAIFSALAPVRARLFINAHDYFLACPNGAYSNFKTNSACELKPLSFACLKTNCDRRSYSHKLWRVARKILQDRAISYDIAGPRILTIHPAMQPRLLRGGVPGDAMFTLPNPIQPWSKTRIQAERNKNFVYVGRLSYEKGPDLVAQAARDAGVPLLMIGDGVLSESLRRDYPEVRFVGRQPLEVIAALVRDARALVMPSRLPEPYGLVACEALWSGLPVILADQALLSTDIADREAGIACDVKNPITFVDAMKRVADDDELTEKLSRNAFDATAELGHRTDDWIDAMIAAYRGAL